MTVPVPIERASNCMIALFWGFVKRWNGFYFLVGGAGVVRR